MTEDNTIKIALIDDNLRKYRAELEAAYLKMQDAEAALYPLRQAWLNARDAWDHACQKAAPIKGTRQDYEDFHLRLEAICHPNKQENNTND